MPIEIDWGDLDNTIIVMIIKGRWTGEQFYTVVDDLHAMSNEQDAPVRLIADMRYTQSTPKNFLPMLKAVVKRPNFNIKHAIVVKRSNYWERLIQMLVQSKSITIDIPVTFVDSVDRAYALLDS